jgi:octopine/nopaline transport system permease protein
MDLFAVWHNVPELAAGLAMTIQLTVLSVAVGLCLAVPLGVLRTVNNRWIKGPIYLYTYIFRGTPLLIQLFLIYYGLAQFEWLRSTFLWDFLREGFWCCIIAFSLNTAAYTTEILRGAIQNVPIGEIEAAQASGMSRLQMLRRIVLPQAFRIMLPAYSNEVIMMMQATSLASLVTVLELTGSARVIIAQNFAPYEVFVTIGLLYLLFTYGLLWLFRRWEGHLMRYRTASTHSGDERARSEGQRFRAMGE